MRNIIGPSLLCTALPASAAGVASASDIITPEFAAGIAAAIAFFCVISWLHTRRNIFGIGILLAFIETVRVLSTSLEATPSVRIALLACAYAASLIIIATALNLTRRLPLFAVFFRINSWALCIAAGALLTMESWLRDLTLHLALWCTFTGFVITVTTLLCLKSSSLQQKVAYLFLAAAFGLTSLVQANQTDFSSLHLVALSPWFTTLTILRLLGIGGILVLTNIVLNKERSSTLFAGDPGVGAEAPAADRDIPAQVNNADLAGSPSQQADRRLAELAGALETQRQMNALMAHELRTPISTISAAAQSLEMMLGDSGEVVESRIARIRRAVTRMAEMTDQLLTQDRLRDQALTPRHELVNIVELANDVVSSTQPDAAHALIVRSDGPINAYCDRSLTSIVLRNLIHNAIKYSPADKPIYIETGLVQDAPNSTAYISVTDNGPGIEDHEQTQIFEPRFRRPAHRETQGMGVGLYLARQICESQGGTLDFQSTLGEGTQFIMTLPTQTEDSSEKNS